MPAGLAVAVAPGSGPGSGDGDGGGWDDELTAETDHESSDPAGRTKKAEAAADSLAQALDRDRIAALTDALQRGPFGVEPLRHSVRLLEAERDRCEAALEADYALLARLERDAAREATELRKTVGRGRHALLRRTGESGEPSDDDGDDDGATMRDEEDADTRATGRLARLLAELEADSVGGDEEAAAASKEVLDLARQAASHMESMRANLAQAAGIPEAVAATHAALRLVLSRHLDAETYESVVLG